jgi:hypothetical protein
MSGTDGLGFLGEEFLTWLWFRIETDGGEFDLGAGRVVGVSFDDFIAFAPRDDDETEQTLRNGLPSRCMEASAALRNGRRLTRARLVFAEGDQTWSTILDGPTLNLTAVKLPEDDADADGALERNLDRIAGFWRLQQLVAQLYREFLRERLRPDYLETTGAAQAGWMSSR